MRIGAKLINIEDLSEDDLSEVINEARRLRSHKADARNLYEGFTAMLEGAKERKLDICNKYTGEVLRAEDWLIYDNELDCTQCGDWAP